MDAPDDDPDNPRFGSPEWEERRRDRHDHPTGRHLRPADADEPPKASPYASNGDVSELAAAWDRFRMHESRERDSDMPPAPSPLPSVRFDWSLNFGHVLTIAAVIGSVVAGYYGIRGEIDKGIAERAELHRQIESVKSDIALVRPKVLADLEAQAKLNATQDNRIENLADGLKQTRDAAADVNRAISKLADAVATMHEDLALLKDRLGRRSNVETPPEHDAFAPGAVDRRHP